MVQTKLKQCKICYKNLPKTQDFYRLIIREDRPNPNYGSIPIERKRKLVQGDIGVRMRRGAAEFVIYYEAKDEWQKGYYK